VDCKWKCRTTVEIRLGELIIDTDETSTGTIVVTKSGDIYQINATLTIGGKELKANYKGTLEYADLFHPGK
jgi:hypothetical protein